MNTDTELGTVASPPSAAAKTSGRKRNLQARRSRSAWLLVAPTLVLLAGVAGWPLMRTIFYSFTDAQLDTPDVYNLVGFANYLDFSPNGNFGVLADPLWWQAVANTFWFTGVSVTFELIFGMLLALLMNQKFRGQGLVRTAILVPWAIPTIVTAKMFSWMFHDQYGMINHILLSWGVIDGPLAWIAEPDLSLWAVVIADVWKTVPFMALMLLAAMQMVPSDLYEAARVDGATAFQRFRRITLPLIFPAMIVALIFRVMDALRVFDLIYVLTSNSEATISISGYAREQMVSYQEMGMGSAASVLVFMMVAGVAAVFLYIGRIGEPKEKQS